MERNKNRLIAIQRMLKFLNITSRRYIAVDGQTLYQDKTYLQKQYPNSVNIMFDYDKQINRKNSTQVSSAQVGCFLSHLLNWKDIAESKRNEPILVLEDDIDLDVNFVTIMKNSIKKLPSDWEIFLCGYCCHYTRPSKSLSQEFIEMDYYLTTHCQMFRNYTVAEKLFKKFDLPKIDIPIDNMLAGLTKERYIKVYGLRTQIAIQRREIYKSEIASSKRIKKERLKNSLLDYLDKNQNQTSI
jgi:GR25 family glycosyltransferase involved in LPS biosynthesis